MDSALGEQLSLPLESPLRVAHLVSSGGFYGLERMLLEHCQHAPGQHLVLLLNGPDELVERFRAAGVALVRCPGLASLWRTLGTPRVRPTLLNGHGFKGLVYGWLSALRFGLPLVTTQHGFTPRNRKQRLYTWLSLQLCRTPQVRRVVCVANSISRLHSAAGVHADKLQVIPNGLPPLPEGEFTRPAQAPAAPLIGFVGRLSAEKGPDLFVELAISLCQRHPALNAVLLGDGPQRQSLAARIDAAGLATRILLPGYREDMAAWLRALDVLVISSRTEGTPMVLLEAMQAGVPVASFSVGGIPDMIRHGVSGLLAPAGAVEELAAAVDALLKDVELRRHLAAGALLVQRDHHHLPAQAGRWLQLYRSAAGD